MPFSRSPSENRYFTALVALVACSSGASASLQAQTRGADTLAPVIVTVTRDRARSTLEVPYAITLVSPDSVRPGMRKLSLDEMLLLVPGVSVSNRNNPTQDPRIAIRGFGARSAFGVRGVHIVRDGIPLTLPDGQTPTDVLDLETVGSLEVLRGSAAALYGNSAGGVVELRSVLPPALPLVVRARSWRSGHGVQRWAGWLGGNTAAASYQAGLSLTQSDGAREHARQRTTHGSGRVAIPFGSGEVIVLGTFFDMPEGQNPGALTAEQFAQDPRMADPLNVQRGAGKVVQQRQAGIVLRRRMLAGGEMTATLHGGNRSLDNPLPFAVIDVQRVMYGGSLRGGVPLQIGGLGARLSAGVDIQRQEDDRSEFANCVGITAVTAACPTAGSSRGTLRRDQLELVTSIGPYVHADVAVGRGVHVHGGVRADQIDFAVRDRFITDTNPDDSGERSLRAVSPILGLVLRFAPAASLYATVSSAFETPTATELGNQPDGAAGINRELRAQRATTWEAGLKGWLAGWLQYDAALFTTAVRDELIPFEIPGGAGRRYFRNAGRTDRRGAELGLGALLGPLELGLAHTWTRFRFVEFTVGSQDLGGMRIPGVPSQQTQASVTVRRGSRFLTAEGIFQGRAPVDDANSAFASGYEVANIRVGAAGLLGRPWLSPVIGVQNLFDRRYAGSINVNATSGKYFEPAPGRTLYAGISLTTGG